MHSKGVVRFSITTVVSLIRRTVRIIRKERSKCKDTIRDYFFYLTVNSGIASLVVRSGNLATSLDCLSLLAWHPIFQMEQQFYGPRRKRQ